MIKLPQAVSVCVASKDTSVTTVLKHTKQGWNDIAIRKEKIWHIWHLYFLWTHIQKERKRRIRNEEERGEGGEEEGGQEEEEEEIMLATKEQ